MTTRQKAIAGGIILIILIIAWQIIGLFRTKTTPSKTPLTVTKTTTQHSGPHPQAEQVAQQPSMSAQQQAALLKLQQDTQAKYVEALNELQMLRLTQQIAETNKDIAAARLATVTAEKGVVDLLTKPTPPEETPASFSSSLVAPGGIHPPTVNAPGTMPGTVTVTTQTTEPAYIVISVSELMHRWSAVLGYQGKLYGVLVGDVLPPDQSTVVSIDRYGVVLEKDGVRRKVSLVPII